MGSWGYHFRPAQWLNNLKISFSKVLKEAGAQVTSDKSDNIKV